MRFAIVTGASTGIGRETAIELAKNNFEVMLIGRNEDELNVTKEKIIKNQGQGIVKIVNLADLEEVKNLAKNLKDKRIDLIANIAGVWHGDNEVYAGINYENFTDEILLTTLNVGILAPMVLCKHLISSMNPNSLIVNLSGTFENGGKGWLPYFVSKRALEDFTIGLADELKEKSIRVVGVSPSDTDTESYKKFFPEYINDSQDPKEIAKFIVDLYLNNKETGTIYVLKRNQPPKNLFHG